MSKKNHAIVKFEYLLDTKFNSIRRISGFIQAKYIVDLIEVADLNANPRAPKVSNITDDIIESIVKTENIFHFKTKGILLSVSKVPEVLERNRYLLTFDEPEIEGVLDGGHNTLAIALQILTIAAPDELNLKKIKKWSDLKEAWVTFRKEINSIKDQLDFLIPIEILTPADDTEEVEEEFRSAILEICAARNNNVQLTVDTMANQAGLYDVLKDILDPKLKNDIIWKTNENGRIPARDLITLTWLPLSKLTFKDKKLKISPVQLYSSKGKCMQMFRDLMENEEVSELKGKNYEIFHEGVLSAFEIAKDLPKLYDYIYKNFPLAYNSAKGNFGKISSVKCYKNGKSKDKPQKYLKKQPLTPFYQEPMEYAYPDGFIMPIVYALSELLDVKDGKVVWNTEPLKFLENNIGEVVSTYKGVIELSDWDPQKVGKKSYSYDQACQSFKYCLLKQ